MGALDLSRVREMECENARLKDRVAELEAAIAEQGEPCEIERVRKIAGAALTAHEARVFAALHLRAGVTTSKEVLLDAIYGDLERSLKIIDVWVCKLRRKLARSAWRIDTVWGVGIRLIKVTP